MSGFDQFQQKLGDDDDVSVHLSPFTVRYKNRRGSPQNFVRFECFRNPYYIARKINVCFSNSISLA